MLRVDQCLKFMYRVEQMFTQCAVALNLSLRAGGRGMSREIYAPEAQRPGIHLTGRLEHYTGNRILVFGTSELNYIASLSPSNAHQQLKGLFTEKTPAIIVARDLPIPKELLSLCEEKRVPLFSTDMQATDLVSRLTFYLYEALSEIVTLHSTLMEIFSLGVLIRGESSVGKSEAALSLVERGHRLIADDVVHLRSKKGEYLEGKGPELTQHMIEIRGIGILNIAQLYGQIRVRDTKKVDLVVHLEEWNPKHFYDRIGLDEKMCAIDGKLIPYYTLPVKPSLDIALLIEAIARIHMIKSSPQQFQKTLIDGVSDKIPERK